ncbi:type 1 glutamine amidotransferase domain-containing protein [Goodfellowiella coeruleoviolacea]|uniref:Intracellular protease/amidase n=1 Tax=Goodfellowiella coeruleoviolacea TaxID=334858 RepID=A0AAE3GK76_9PSEU|nr:type 1 glutamine amidotransferase domain-containing protein [Goodfellowiella coeruleoviolacea]MCP2169787.1 putative intracellular protease/amidase [Goodfellowiella coeruleoviolacea]
MTRTNRVLIVLTSHDQVGDTGDRTGYYVPEAAHPWQVFRAAGFQVDLVSVRGGTPPQDGLDPADPVQRDFLADPGIAAQLADTRRPGDVDPADYAAVFYAGGHGTMWDFPDNPELARLGSEVHAAGGVVAAVCHGPAALVGLTLPDGTPLVRGRQVTGFSNAEEHAVGRAGVVPFLLEDRLTELGGHYRSAPNFQAHVVTDDRLVTGQNPASATGTAEAVVRVLTGPTAAAHAHQG